MKVQVKVATKDRSKMKVPNINICIDLSWVRAFFSMPFFHSFVGGGDFNEVGTCKL
jgi:hypothetical protein